MLGTRLKQSRPRAQRHANCARATLGSHGGRGDEHRVSEPIAVTAPWSLRRYEPKTSLRKGFGGDSMGYDYVQDYRPVSRALGRVR
jgi:hypothetical protein